NDIIIDRGREITKEQQQEFGKSFDGDKYQSEWNNTVFQAFFATAIAVFATGSIVFLTNINFGFLEGFLLISLIILVLMSVLNILIFRSTIFSFISSYFGAVIFTLYLLFDFNRLESIAGDESWATAIDISVNLYLDIINLFLDLLTIISELNS
ncbi:MAG: Bax inhibitor-1 family protein, partial [Candidatus Paceibacterota bacterium]